MRAVALALVLLSTLAHADGRLAEATMERRVFRQIFVGRIVYPSRRLTWVLHRGGDAARLELFCQEGAPEPRNGIRIDGKELDEAYWQEPVSVRYAGTRAGKRLELRMEGSAPGGRSRCATMPQLLTLTCADAKLKVRPAGAVIVPGKGDDPESTPPPKWKPAGERPIAALRCVTAPDDEQPLVFAPTTVEWADENSDMTVQTGAYRFLK